MTKVEDDSKELWIKGFIAEAFIKLYEAGYTKQQIQDNFFGEWEKERGELFEPPEGRREERRGPEWKNLKEKWLKKAKQLPGKVGNIGANVVGRAIVPKRAFREPLTQPPAPPPKRELLALPQKFRCPAGDGEFDSYDELQRHFTTSHAGFKRPTPPSTTPIPAYAPGTPEIVKRRLEEERRLVEAKKLVEESRRKPAERPPTGGPPALPEGRREEREERGYGTITGGIEEKSTRKPLPEAEVIAFSPEIQRDIPGDVYVDKGDKKTKFTIQVPTTSKGILYTIYAQASKHKRSTRKQVVVKNDETKDIGTLELEPEEKPTATPFTIKWFKDWTGNKDNWIKLGIAFAITLAVNFWLYRPLISGIGIESNLIMDVILPFLFFLVMFFTLPKEFKKPGDWSPIVLGILAAGGTVYALNFRTGIELAPFIRFGIPLIIYYIVWYFTTKNIEKKRGIVPTIVGIAGLIALVGVGIFLFTLIQSGGLTNMETYLKPLNILHIFGVPQDTIDNVKDGVRNVLSFLQFKGAEPVKPEAKKIGGFEAIQLKFGSKYNNYLLPTLFARMDYSLPVTVINPNKFGTNLVVKNFVIDYIFLNNRSDEKVICGSVGEDPDRKGQVVLGDVSPEEEKMTIIDFKGKTTAQNGKPYETPAIGSSVDCRDVLKDKGYRPENPMFPAEFRIRFSGEPDKNQTINNQKCFEQCKPYENQINANYGVKNELDKTDTRFISSSKECECSVRRYFNIMDDLCFMYNDKAKVTLRTSYDFSVQGKGELILAKTVGDAKLAPKPTITSSAGPLTVTTYFVSDVHIFESSALKSTTMFIEISNAGDGDARITGLSINTINVSKFFVNGITKIKEIPLSSDKVKITSCSPNPSILTVKKESVTVICKLDTTQEKSIVSGSYMTVPTIVDVNYTYLQGHSTTINVKKEVVPEGVIGADQIIELNRQFRQLPYYCPTKEITDPATGEVTTPLKIYNP